MDLAKTRFYKIFKIYCTSLVRYRLVIINCNCKMFSRNENSNILKRFTAPIPLSKRSIRLKKIASKYVSQDHKKEQKSSEFKKQKIA